ATVLAHGVAPSSARSLAHFHSPTLISAAATELAIGATNQSLDSYDQAPAATLVEDHLVRWLATRIGLSPGATGVLTAGGTASNLLGLLLAREHAAARTATTHATGTGMRAVVITSEAAHFSVAQACLVLGLGRSAAVTVAVDDHGRMGVGALSDALTRAGDDGDRVVAVVATVGTTDLGAVDAIDEIAALTRAHDTWLHVDAALGSAFALSDRLRHHLDGIEHADSVTADLHKLWWQPISASALLVRDPNAFAVIADHHDYLNRADDEERGVLNLVGRSLDTSRRFDALKAVVSLRATGRREMAAMLEHVVDEAHAAAATISAHQRLELLAPPSTVTVVFRWVGDGAHTEAELDAVNCAIQQQVFEQGRAVIGRTRWRGRVALKLSIVNPLVDASDVGAVLDEILAVGEAVATTLGATTPGATATVAGPARG
ncbi:MAG: pyridoxal-dependent decarboxylase, partial [Acidimicrobiia bacterium]